MKDQTSEQMSAMVDGEINASQIGAIVDRIKDDVESKGQWERYHLIRDVLNNNVSTHIDNSFADRVMGTLESEADIVSLSSISASRIRGAVKQLIGLSIAASVAVVSFVTYDSFIQGPGINPSLANATEESATVEQVKLAKQLNPPTQSSSDLDQRINSYLVNHNEYAFSNGMNGVSPHVRLVSQEKP